MSGYCGHCGQDTEVRVMSICYACLDKLKLATNARVLTCVYCGHEYPQGTPAAGDKVLTDHIRICPKHPLRKAEQDIAALTALVAHLRSSLECVVRKDDMTEQGRMAASYLLYADTNPPLVHAKSICAAQPTTPG